MIYMARAGDDGPVKIGTSRDAQKRLRSLKGATHVPLSIIRLLDGNRKDERELHREFRHLHIQGEWFRFDPRMLDIELRDIIPVPPKHKPSRLTKAAKAAIIIPEHAPPHIKLGLCLQAMGWSQRELVRRIRCDTNLPLRWLRGETAIPLAISKWLETLARNILNNPSPNNWRDT
jgi:hypothetical protein